MTPIDNGQNDPIPFDLTGFKPLAEQIKKDLEALYGRELTEIPEAA